ncbi:hypothetical protein ACHHYP_07690 [Achlya hypogyna]|uniref:Reverse transcriptase zinc-binding domain-containing protein n=1 Tax=Achlya hypogyna TaxID=1202772 RepID=A0A1V9YQR4_ACHHY|nr:hypothetical protein ACHHYP_07690 [Achlya hypogyna]
MLCMPSFPHTIATRCSVAGVSLSSTPSRIFKPAAQRKSLPTAQINVANDFYNDPDNLAAAAGLWLPTHVLLKFSDFVYRVLIRGVAMRSQLHYLEDKTCVLCNTGDLETYTHLQIDCPFTQDVWNLFTAALSAFGFSYPTSLQACLFDTPRLQRRWQCLCFDQVWPMVRACIWFTLWKARNDVIFRQNRTPAPVALKAAFAVKIHLQHLVLQDPEDHMLLRFLLSLEQNVWARAHLVPRCVV